MELPLEEKKNPFDSQSPEEMKKKLLEGMPKSFPEIRQVVSTMPLMMFLVCKDLKDSDPETFYTLKAAFKQTLEMIKNSIPEWEKALNNEFKIESK